MLNDYSPIYDENLSVSNKIMKNIMQQCIYEDDVHQQMMSEREAAQIRNMDSCWYGRIAVWSIYVGNVMLKKVS